jgi:K+-transporting ATPase KdpF subunit
MRLKAAQLCEFCTARMVLIYQLHDGPNFCCRNRRVLRDRAQLCLGVHPPMSPWELVMGSIMAVGLTAYLVYAMLRPEKF